VLEVEEELQLDWAEGWFTSAQLGFPLLEDNFDRHLHPLITQYISAKQQHNAIFMSLMQKWKDSADLVECNGCGAEVGASTWWHCTKCIDEDLCQHCYHLFLTEGKHHDTDHIFIPQNAGGTVKSTSTDPGKRLDWEPYSVPHLAKDPIKKRQAISHITGRFFEQHKVYSGRRRCWERLCLQPLLSSNAR
jgi:hypothetical protein